MVFNFRPINTYLATFILTVALIVPKTAPESQNTTSALPEKTTRYAIEAPKTSFLSIDEYARQAAYDAGIDSDKFQLLISCESHWQEDAAGDNNRSFGILQFQKETFTRFAKKYDLRLRDISDSYDQIDLAVLMIRDGYVSHWKNCARKIKWNE